MTHKNDAPTAKEPELRAAPRSPRVQESSQRLGGRIAIARAIIEARMKKRWTQKELAASAGTKQSRISELESARGNPTLETIEKVARALELEFFLKSPAPTALQPYTAKNQMAAVFIIGQCGPSHRFDVEAQKFEEVSIPTAVAARLSQKKHSRLA